MFFCLGKGIMDIIKIQKRLEKGLLVGLFVHELSLNECLNEGNNKKYRENRIFWEIAFFLHLSKRFFRNLLVQKCQFWFWREILRWSKDFIQQILKFWFFRILWPFKVINFVKICQNIAILYLIFVGKIYLFLQKST